MAKNSGGNNAAKQVAYLWARTMGGESAVKLLRKLGYLDQCIEYACESLQVRHHTRGPTGRMPTYALLRPVGPLPLLVCWFYYRYCNVK